MPIITGTINERSPRYNDWLTVFQSGTIPLMSTATFEGAAPGLARAEFYRLAVSQLDKLTRLRLILFLATRFGVPETEVAFEVDHPEIGVPILAEDVSIYVDARAFL